MAPFQHLQKWLTLTSQCFANFSNAISFGIFFSNINVFATYYSIRPSTIENTFYIGLVLEIIFCIPALKLIEWRMDYSIMCASFLTMTAYWVQYTAQDNFVVVLCCMLLQSFAQALLLPLSGYLAERWFPLKHRSIAVSLSFYSNLLGFSFGAIFTTLFVITPPRVLSQLFIISLLSTFFFVVSVVLVKNKPKKMVEKYRMVSFKQVKELWKYKYNTYSIIMSSVFLGLSWTFLSSISLLGDFFTPVEVGIFVTVWVVSGSLFGLITSGVISLLILESGSFKIYDRISKIILSIGIVGYILMGVCFAFQFKSFTGYIFLMVIIGIGSIGYYGLILLSLIQTFHPISSLLICNLIVLGASIYAALATSLSLYSSINIYFILAAVAFLPFIYLACTYQTDFKRYRYYFDEKTDKYSLLKLEEYRNIFNEKKYE